ncbi:translocation/assembly module TamB domain-containing protein [Noviherbaspirillum sedimenti]|uniref:translocation/assembly module TamB domain-containing protein n=1 Tax=Noviherbaspirillum sedimenti TaxID=2320865 RepID=UPI001314A461|nr:translocation/assembly module TamB domain-containing protein [Noviherbaspirillum sedimenti]
MSAALALAALGLLALFVWLGATTGGARAVLSALAAASGGNVRIGAVDGRLTGPLHLQQLTLQSAGLQTELQDIRLDWRPQALLQGRLHVTTLRIGTIQIRQRIGQPATPAALPASLSLPLRLNIDSVQVGRGRLDWGALNVVELGAFTMHLDYDGARYRLALEKLTASTDMQSDAATGAAGARVGKFHGSMRGQAELADTRPYPLSGVFHAEADALIGQQRLAGAGKLQLDGSLAQLQTGMDFAMGAASLKGRARLQPFSDLPLGDAEINLQGLDLAVFGAGLPRTRLSGKLATSTAGGTLTLTNAEAGTYDAGRLPLRALSSRFRQDAQGLHFDAIAAALGAAAEPAGDIRGSAQLAKGTLDLALATTALDLRRLDRRVLATRLAGNAVVRHVAGRQEFTLELSEPLQSRRLALSAQATLADEALALQRAELRLGDGTLRASGRQQLTGKREFSASGVVSRFHLQDLGRFNGFPDLYLNGEFSLSGALAPQLTAALDFRIADSRLANQPLQGNGRARLHADSLDIPKLTLAAGVNRLDIAGQLQPQGGQLTFALAAPSLAQFGAGFAGALEAKGTARGSFTRPRIAAEWHASHLRLQDLLQLDSLHGSGELDLDRKAPWLLGRASMDATAQGVRSGAAKAESLAASLRFAPPANAPLTLQVRAQKIAAADYRADSLTVDASGTTGRHTLVASLAQAGQQWRLQASGALQAQALRWQGSIDQLSGSGRLQARLAGAAPLEVSRQRIELRQFRLEMDDAILAIEQLRRDEQGIQTRGRFEHLPLAALLPYLRPQPDISTDLLFGGEWDVRLAGVPSGTLSLRRERGDLATRGMAPVALGLTRLEASARAGSGKLQLQLHADGANLGSIEVDAGLALGGAGRFGISPQSALSGGARLTVPTLRWAAPMIAATAIADGSLDGALSIAGSLAAPRLAGQVNGRSLRLALPDLGVDLRGGSLAASFQDTRLLVHNLTFAQGPGKLSIAGPIDLAGAQPDVQLTLKAERYPLLVRSDRKLVVSGDGAVSLREGRLQATGGFTADSGLIDIGQADRPTLSDDVVVVGATPRKAVTPLALDLVIGLGEGIVIRGRGIDAVLVGQLQFKNDAGEQLKAQGAMRIVRGTFAAYGRKLDIEKGLLYFNGPPGNPGLDILAMRRGQQVEAGVAVLGTALTPRIVLVSEPAVADAEKLSWLVLGRGLDAATGGADLAALQDAAASLLTQGAAAGVQAGLAGAFGLDQLSLGTSSDSLQQRIVTIGKQVSSRLHIGIEQGLETASSVLLLRYTISRKLSLEIDTGARSAFTLFYNFAFD